MESDCFPVKKEKQPPALHSQTLARQVGERIRIIRCQRKISVEALALQCDINPAYLGCVERGLQNPTLLTLERISSGLEVGIEELFRKPESSFNSTSAAFQHIKSAMADLTPEQAKKLVQIIDAVIEMHR